jgi:ABC-type phosphate transport system substrate-binding protein
MTQQLKDKGEDEREMTKVRALVGVLAVLVSLAFAAGCGLVSDQTKQEAKKKVESKAQQAEQEAKKKIEAKGSRPSRR